MTRARVVLFVTALCISFSFTSFAQVQTSRKPVITAPADNGATIVLAGSRHALAQARFDVGAVDPGTKLNRVMLALSPTKEAQAELQSFLDRQQDKKSADYHRWLTPEEFGAKYGPAPQDLQTIKSWFERQGIQVTSVAKSGLWMELSGTSAQMETAFKTQMRQYKVNGESHIANASELSIPAAFAPVVSGVVSLHNFFKKPVGGRTMQSRLNGIGSYLSISPDATLPGGTHTLTPGDYAKIYDISSLYNSGLDGAGIHIGLIARSDISLSDYNDFRTLTNVTGGTIANVLTLPPDPGFDPDPSDLDSVEATLDAQWAGGVAKGASVQVIVSSSTATTDGVDLSAAFAVDQNQVDVISASFGQCESSLGAPEIDFFGTLWEQAATQGISVFVSSGDNGAAGCDAAEGNTAATHGRAVSGLASTPFNTAVGGTEFNEGANSATYWGPATSPFSPVSVNGYIPEMVWSETCTPATLGSQCAAQDFFSLESSSGGQSAVYIKPSWQTEFPSAPNPIDTMRDVPDVSLSAAGHDGYLVCFAGSCEVGQIAIVGGTSASSPSFAGIMAIVDQALGGRQGLANYTLYRLARSGGAISCSSSARTVPTNPVPANCVFNDVTVGNNSVPGQTGFNATTGYDLATGLGSVNAANLVSAWQGLTTAIATTTALTVNGGSAVNLSHGTPIPVSVTVSDTGGPAPTGAVGLVSSTAGSFGALPLTTGAGSLSAGGTNVNNLPGGTYTLIAHYPGDSVTAPSDSNAVGVTINPEGSSTSLTTYGVNPQGFLVQSSNFAYGDFMEVNARVAGISNNGTATGRVDFKDSGVIIAGNSVQVNPKGEADFFFGLAPSPQPLTPGTHSLTATYGGDVSFASSTSTPLNVIIGKGNPGVTVAASTTLVATQSGILFASIQATGPILATGTVQFSDAGVPLGAPVALSPGGTQATLTTTFQNEGTHNITASYSGDTTYNAVSSAPTPIVVAPPFGIQPIDSANASANVVAGQTATYNLIASSEITQPNFFSGTVALTCSGAPAGTTCAINPTSVTLTSAAGVPFTVTVTTTTSASLHKSPFRGLPMVFASVFALVFSLKKNRKHVWKMAVVAVFALGISSCGGGGSTPTPPVRPPTASTIVVTGTSGGHSDSVSLALTITH